MNILTLALTLSVANQAADLAEAAGIKGGLIVHVGCKDAPPAAGERFVVQGLCTSPETVAALRKQAKPYGRVSVELFDGQRLPYVDQLVNLLIISDACKLSATEIRRVLVPGGAALVKAGLEIPDLKTAPLKGLEGWSCFRQPWPKEIDEWTHYLHDPQGTSVSDDLLAGPPGGMRWTGGPFWARSHEHTASMYCLVSAAGRLFYVMDEGPKASIQLPPRVFITARDAFNGTVLWKRPLRDWFNPLYPLKSGPGWIPRRLVAVKDKVYLGPGIEQDLLCLDAVTGKVIHTYPDTATAFEVIVSDGVIFVTVDPDRKACDYNQQHANCWKERDRASNKWAWTPEKGTRVLRAIEAESGKLLWKRETPVTPMSLIVDGTMACYHDGNAVVALDRNSGKELWKSENFPLKQVRTGYSGPRMLFCGDRVLFSPMGSMAALSAKTGKTLWTVKKKQRSGHFSLEDFYVLGDKVWVMHRSNQGAFTLYNLKDGKEVKQISNPVKSFYIHQRCHPGRATRRYQLPPMMGIQLYDMEKDTWVNNHWVRGGCVYGVMPANGMVYATPHACACYYQSKLNGFNGLAPEPQSAKAPPAGERLTKGPAFGSADKEANYPASAWPVFRHDNTRSGYVKTDVPAEVAQAWKKDFGTKISQPVFAGGKLFLSVVDEHAVCALDAATGKEAWRFITGGRVDSPPTLYQGLALFGCKDGCIYALRASDGALAWKFQAAPNDRKVMSFGQLESVWPLSGTVLVQGGKLYAVAGRSMFLDGGVRMLILNPATGELLSENVMDHRVPGTRKNLQDLMMGKHMPVALPDILSSDGRHVFMKSQTFTLDGKRVRVRPQRPDTQYGEEVHLFSPISFLDDSWHQRTYWIYGRAAGEGWAEFQLPPKRVPYGRILCLDEKNAYSYARDLELLCNCSVHEYRLFSADKIPAREVGIPKLEGTWIKGTSPTKDPLAAHTVDWKQLSQQPKEKLTALNYNWIKEEPDIMARAMVLANDRLFIAGPRDVVDERAMWGRSNETEYNEKMKLQAAWLEGKHGGFMQVYAKKDGKKLAEHKLGDLPAFDGMIAAEGSLYMTTAGGSLIRFNGN
jgi:outer membrane protein assembly factor BamB